MGHYAENPSSNPAEAYLQFVSQFYWYGNGIRTHDLQNMSLLPLPLEQGSCQNCLF